MSKKTKSPFPSSAAFLPLFLAASFAVFLLSRAAMVDKAARASPIFGAEERASVEASLDLLYPERKNLLKALPYAAPMADFELWAGAAILVDAKTGFVLYEKNADDVIPPASMTKLFLMRSVLEKVRRGEASLGQNIPLGPESWACNAPPQSSLMFLGKGQIATLEDLLCGLSVASGNDAAMAVAVSLFGSMDNFIKEANVLSRSLGLKKTVIVESSGYSENNLTTPREMAAFCRAYIKDCPDALKKFHSIKNFVYPKERNLPPEQRGRPRQDFSRGIPQEIWTPMEFENTNKLLGVLPGCDGIKTGHIIESGYNLALTTERGGERWISVTMKGPGSNMREGDMGRRHDGTALHEWAYKNFRFFDGGTFEGAQFAVPLYGSQKMAIRLVPKKSAALVVPKNASLSVKVSCPKFLFGKIDFGAECGSICIYDGERLLEEIPLVAAEESRAANQFVQRSDQIILRFRGAR